MWLVAFCVVPLAAQYPISLAFRPTFNHKPLALHRTYLEYGASIAISQWTFYIADVTLYKGDTPRLRFSPRYHLITMDGYAPYSLTLECPDKPEFDNLRFFVGIDSSTQMNGVLEGDLDPVNGMYWSWQSGYIHVKLEGVSSASPTRLNRFQLHIGGFRFPFDTRRPIILPVSPKPYLTIDVEITPLLSFMHERKIFQVMRPGSTSSAFV